ncbi:hypothetical protein PSACC_02764 [Paramicrosporidium saccamoebae]|uniref:Uncharacterized protein n=1 Tax=Paramicrosporidium saccamoebae TaxID=1246581 RepID=A0A2H9TI86_9FUNG|nr:hypothetical protein PSACC_02764 [Paramicrosporidium saccamoebae]
MGIRTVAVYSEADSHSLHVEMADEAVCVVDNILGAIKQTGAQAVHPGYGFLSENFKFCQVLKDHGVVFIGPPVKAMAEMGDKIESKIIAKAAGVHTIPGFNGVVRDENHAIEIVAASESQASFGDDRLLLEKYVEEPRHIEIQILGDQHGNTVYLPERECSIQRRNQKVIEEAPSMAITPELWKVMGEQAVQLAKKVGYFSAGTVEFLVDKHKNFYFLEMNTRLQVEHPITEYVTGIDLVEQMIRVAANQKLRIKQSDVKVNGWAFESRVYAEDPKLFLPSIGRLLKYQEPLETGKAEIRCDSGIKEGSEISIYYDPLICKLCTHGPDRKTALDTMNRALDSYVIRGITHNIPVLREVLSQKRFKDGKITTKYLSEEFPGGFDGHQLSEAQIRWLTAVAAFVYNKQSRKSGHVSSRDEAVCVEISGLENTKIQVLSNEDGSYRIKVGDVESNLFVKGEWNASSPILRLLVDNQPLVAQFHGSPHLGRMIIQAWGTVYNIWVKTALEDTLSQYMPVRSSEASDRIVLAPMAGQMVSVSVKVGDTVREGAEIAVIEAMKMQNVLRAPKAGKVTAVNISPGQNVSADEPLIELEYL